MSVVMPVRVSDIAFAPHHGIETFVSHRRRIVFGLVPILVSSMSAPGEELGLGSSWHQVGHGHLGLAQLFTQGE